MGNVNPSDFKALRDVGDSVGAMHTVDVSLFRSYHNQTISHNLNLSHEQEHQTLVHLHYFSE